MVFMNRGLKIINRKFGKFVFSHVATFHSKSFFFILSEGPKLVTKVYNFFDDPMTNQILLFKCSQISYCKIGNIFIKFRSKCIFLNENC